MAWYRRLRNLIRSDRHADELERELAFHLRERADELRAGGLSERDAAAEARRRFGNRTLQKERTHDADVITWLESVLADLRYAIRDLVKSPGFALVAVLSLALGIGANTAIFSLTNAVVLKSLPVSHPEQLVDVYMKSPGDRNPRGNVFFTNPLWEQIRHDSSVFSGVFAYADATFNLSPTGEVRNVTGAWVSGDFFRTLGVRAEAGRLLRNADDVRGCPGVAVVSDGLAEREFGGAQAAVGKTVSLSGNPFTIAGVADPAFFGLQVGQQVDVYAPICAETMLRGPKVLDARSRWYMLVVGRVKPGLTTAQVSAELAARAPAMFRATLPPSWGAALQAGYLKTSLGVVPAPSGISGVRIEYRTALLFLLAAVAVVLLIACVNIANLLLARGARRQREISIRMAIGAGRGRVMRQLLTESLVLALVGTGLGAVFGAWAARLLAGSISVVGQPVSLDLRVDPHVLAFTAGVAIVTALLFGLLPAYRATTVDPQASLKQGGRGVARGDALRRAGAVLVTGQIGLSLALLSVAALLLNSFRNIVTQDPGFDPQGVLLVSAGFSKAVTDSNGYAVAERQLLDRLREVPGVTDAAGAMLTPVSGTGWNSPISIPGRARTTGHGEEAFLNQVSSGYFATLRTPVIAGRAISATDGPGAPRVAVVNEAFARRFFGRASPIGRTFSVALGDSAPPAITIVGVVQTSKYASYTESPRATAYLSMGQSHEIGPSMNYLLRVREAPETVIPAIEAAAAQMSPAITLQFSTLEDQIATSVARPRLLATLSGYFGGLAILLAVIGLYGTMSYAVTQRRNEIGIRMALGAGGPRMLRMILREAGRLVALGLAAGMLLALATTRYASSFLYHLTPTDPVTLGFAVTLLGAVAMAAALLPAWRASHVDPMEALREE